ncbi:hypothetical protein CI238_08887 [Colletotrichum incanum]|uniref:Uncharacterized protein n=1 Tax=Colletotrichum incanum TaxID=1573173 RepID=A0A166QP83_COLIC|nr:hypothetical protein CI238_08887 [Colletotrichum incanum]
MTFGIKQSAYSLKLLGVAKGKEDNQRVRGVCGPVISDRATLGGASKAEVRKHFRSWCEARSEERDGRGATDPGLKDYHDTDTVFILPANYRGARMDLSNMVTVIIDGACDKRTPGDDEGSYPDIEGCTERYVCWRYEEVEMLVGTYEESHQYPLNHIDYKRPPLISSFGHESMPA